MKHMRIMHKYFGIATAIIIIIVSLTGILLIHKKFLGLNKIFIRFPGYSVQNNADVFDVLTTAEGFALVATKQGIYMDTPEGWIQTLPSQAKRLYRHEGTFYVCSNDGLYTSEDGKIWEKTLSEGEACAMVIIKEDLFVSTKEAVYQRKSKEKVWNELIKFPVRSLDVRDIDVNERGILIAAKGGLFIFNKKEGLLVENIPLKKSDKIELQKLITDIHTGDFFGKFFYIIMDITAFGLIVLSITGLYMWYRVKKIKNDKKKWLTTGT